MRRFALVIVISAAAAHAQDERPEPTPSSAQTPEPAQHDLDFPHDERGVSSPPQGQKPESSSTAAASPQSKDDALKIARQFFTRLLEGDAQGAVAQSTVPFTLEQRKLGTTGELLQAWLKSLHQKRTDLLTLYGIELLTPTEMEARYGKPPARLATFPYRDGSTCIALANLSGHAAIALLRPSGGGYRVVGYTD
jgi:hypothetical protein